MKITLIEANQDLGVNVNGANLGPNVLTSYFKEQDLMFMLFDVILTAVVIENKKHGLFSKENTNQSGSDSSNQIGMLLDKIGKLDKESTRDRLLACFEGLQSSN